jgi:PPOX class probable F420-dependent enzyme
MATTPTTAADDTDPERPAPRPLDAEEVSRLLAAGTFGTLAAVRRSGHPHLTTVLYSWDPEERVARVSTTAERAKPRMLARDPHAALHVSGPDVWSFAVAEGEAEVSAPTTAPGDAVGRELLSLVPPFTDPAEETAFLEEAVAEHRVVVRLRATRLYGTALNVPAPAPADG